MQRLGESAQIEDVGLHQVDSPVADHPGEGRDLDLLLAARHIDIQCLGHGGGRVEVPPGHRLLVMRDAIILQHPAHGDGARHGEARIGVNQRVEAAQRPGYGGDDGLGPALPLVAILAHLGADAELGGGEALLGADPLQALGLLVGGQVTPHGTGIGPHRPGAAADQRGDRLARAPACHVPERGVEPGQRPVAVRAGEFVLGPLDAGDQRGNVGRILAQRPRGDLAVKDAGGYVGVIGRGLAPADGAILGRRLDEADEFVVESLEADQAHGRVPGLPSD